MASDTPKQSAVAVRPETKAKFDEEAAVRRVPLIEMADLAIDAWRLLNKRQQDAVIERRHAPTAA